MSGGAWLHTNSYRRMYLERILSLEPNQPGHNYQEPWQRNHQDVELQWLGVDGGHKDGTSLTWQRILRMW